MKKRTHKLFNQTTNPFKYISIVMGLLLFLSCKFQPKIQEEGALFLQGKWEQNIDSTFKNRISYTKHHFKFTCDSFYVRFQTLSKVNYYNEECFNNGIWNEYAKGRYVMLGDTLFVIGTFTKANFKQKISGCYRNGEYLEKFIVKNNDSSSLTLQSLTSNDKLKFKLIEKIKCIPKPL